MDRRSCLIAIVASSDPRTRARLHLSSLFLLRRLLRENEEKARRGRSSVSRASRERLIGCDHRTSHLQEEETSNNPSRATGGDLRKLTAIGV